MYSVGVTSRVSKVIEYCTTFSPQIKELRLTTAEAIKSKEDAEHKCQHKTADIVALMEKHKVRFATPALDM